MIRSIKDVESPAEILLATRSQHHRGQWSEVLHGEGYIVRSCADEDHFHAVFHEASQLNVIIVEAPFFATDDLIRLRGVLDHKGQGCGSLMIIPERARQTRQAALDAGIDMPMMAPVTSGEVISAVRSLLGRHPNVHTGAAMETGEAPACWSCDPVSWRILAPGGLGVARLTYREIEFVLRLAKQPGLPVRREEFSYLFGVSAELFDPRRLEVMVRRMRKTILAETGQELPLLTAHGVGYALGTHLEVIGTASAPSAGSASSAPGTGSISRAREVLTKPTSRTQSRLQEILESNG